MPGSSGSAPDCWSAMHRCAGKGDGGTREVHQRSQPAQAASAPQFTIERNQQGACAARAPPRRVSAYSRRRRSLPPSWRLPRQPPARPTRSPQAQPAAS